MKGKRNPPAFGSSVMTEQASSMLIGPAMKFQLAETGKVVDSAMRVSRVKPP